MSRIGKKTIKLPSGVTFSSEKNELKVKGPKGELVYEKRPEISVSLAENELVFEIAKETKESPAFWGLTRALVNNMILGVSEGFEKKLELIGVGYRVKPNGQNITLSLGFSHPVEIVAPKGITFEVPDQQTIIIKGIDKQAVGLIAAKIRKLKKPEPYKGKGIKYSGEIIRRKAGKSAKK